MIGKPSAKGNKRYSGFIAQGDPRCPCAPRETPADERSRPTSINLGSGQIMMTVRLRGALRRRRAGHPAWFQGSR